MFDHEQWRREIADRLGAFARNPRQELQLAGAPSLLAFLAAQTLAPFLESFHSDPIDAVLALSSVTRSSGANMLVHRAMRRTHQSASQLDRELRGSPEIRRAVEQLLVELQVITLVRQRLNGARDEWLRATLERDLDAFPGEFQQLRRVVADPGGQARFEALRRLRLREGRYSPADIVLLHESLGDSSAQIRASAARLLGMLCDAPPILMIKKLIDVALRDCDAETRFAAARAIGMLRDFVTSPHLLDLLAAHLTDKDRFYRASAALVLGQLGEMAGAPNLVRSLTRLLEDEDAYVREAAARALGRIGVAAATLDVLQALTGATQDPEMQVHEAATDSLITLRDIRGTKEVEFAAAV